ncbi:hypothetical protein [Vibrio phage vB_VhaM_VH-8]|nr:hypothetical protein [Vibrio phage vB_VhaM_VH-8]
MSKVVDTSSFISKSKEIYGDIYDYGKTEYIASKDKITVSCKIHGDWETIAYNHLRGRGCPKCNYKNRRNRLKTEAEFINDSRKVHGGTYSYKNTKYNGDRNKVTIECRVHGDFSQTAGQHLQRKGCPKCGDILSGCSKTQFRKRCVKNNDGVGILYIIKCKSDNESFYKVGIASTKTNKRFLPYNMPYEYKLIMEVELNPEVAFNLEKIILKDLSIYKYRPKIIFGGHTECFSKLEPILKLLDKLLEKGGGKDNEQ